MKSIKRILRVLGLLTFASLGVTVCEAQTPPTRIMPLGDSLTSGVSSNIVPGAYRNRLYSLLTTAGYNVDFVGMNTDSSNPSLPDKDHQGVGGARIDEIQAGVTGWLNSVEDPDVVLLLIGTNDFSQNFNTGAAQTRLTNLITDIATKRPFAKVIVSTLPLRTDDPNKEAQQVAFNAALPGIVNTQVSLGRQVSLVDMHSAWVAGDLVEGVHPNQTGYNKMADVWLPAITNVITPLGTSNPPAIVRTGPPTTLQQLTVRFSKPLADSAASLANFSLNGGLSVSAASLDAATKRIITLTTSTQTPGTLYTLSVTGVRDRTPAANLIATGSTIAFSTEAQNNGSFESDFASWTSTGNMEIKNASPYTPTNGSKLVAFNQAQLAPNGVLTQTFATTPGVPYVLSFDAGALGINSQQRMQVTVSGSSTLVSQTVTITGPGTFTSKWVPQSFSFVANTPTTTMSFADTSTTSDSVDLLLDNVRLTAQVPRTLTVSSTPTTGINVTLTPNDLSGAGGAPTGFSRQYLNGSVVTLTAPSVAGANAFVKWQKNGTDLTTNTSTTVTLDADYTLNAIYSANNQVLANGSFENGFTSWTNTGNQEIKNASPYLATDGSKLVAFNGGNLTPNGVLSQTFTTVSGVSYTLAFDAGILSFNTSTQSLQVTATGSGSVLSQVVNLSANTNGASRWFPQTFTFIANSSSTTLTFRDQSATTAGLDLLLDNVRVTGPVGPVNNSPVAVADAYTTNFNTALVVPTTGVLTNDTDSESNPLTAVLGTGPTSGSLTLNPNGSFTYTPNSGFSGTDSFTYRANDGNSNSNLATVTITVNGLAVGSLVNGSFESGETGWTFSGNYLVYGSDGSYIAYDGTKMVVLHGGPTTPNAVISQAFATTPGQTYQLAFALGTFGGNGVTQSIQVALAGTTPILTQTESVIGTNSATSSWTPKTINFTANSATTTLTFTDNSATTNAVDMLLDKVSVGIPSVNTAPVAVADSYSTNQNTALVVPAAGVLSNDTDSESNPLTAAVVANPTSGTLALSANGSFTYTPNSGFSGSDSFTYKANDGTSDSNTATVSITVNPPVAPTQLLVNGSFESLEAGWTMTGNRLAYESDGTYVATNGTKLLVLSGGPSTPDAVITQSFTTIAGQTYTLTFDIGTVSGNTSEQRIGVSVTGNASLLSQLASVFGTNAPGSAWTSKTYSFVADSTSTTLTFSDLSPTSNLIDLLLDNVRVSGQGGPVNNPPGAVADSYTATQNTPLVVAASGVLANDTDTESNPLTAAVVAGPASGVLVLNPNGGFTYTPNNGFTGPDSFTYKANDGNSNSNTATVSITVNPGVIGVLVNGSFENNFTGWTTTGNQVIENAAPYAATNGTKLVGFNGGNLLPNAVLSQTFGTVSGQTYTLAFDAGVLAFNTNPQKLNVTVNGTASLLTQNITINGPGNGTNVWFPQSFTFVADSASTTLTFRDQSSSTAGLDLTLDNVRVTGPAAVNTAPVAVADSYTATQNTALVVPAAGVLSNDTDAQNTSLTALVVSNPTSGTLALSANGSFTYTPNTGYTGPDSFTYKANDGLLDSNVVIVSITVNAAAPNNQLLVNGGFESNFSGWTTTGNQFIETAAPYVASEGTKLVAFNGGNLSPNGVLSQSFATVTGQTYTLAFDAGVLAFNSNPQKLNVTVKGTASLLGQDITINGISGTQRWVAQSFTFIADSTVTTLTFKDQSASTSGLDLTLDNVRVNGPPGVPNTAPVATGESYSTAQGTALVVAAPGVLANDTDAELSPLTAAVVTGPANGTLTLASGGGFTYTPNSGFSGSDSFTYRANDGVLNSNTATVSLTVSAVSVGGLANGSFESGETVWSFSGNYLVYPSDGTYVAFNGTNLVVLHGGPTTPNAVISQSFATTPGTTYNFGFALGTVGGNGVNQSIKVDVTGTGSLLSQTQSVTGTSSATSVWTPQTLSFTANSAVTTLTFTDVSTATNAVDMLLDNVTVSVSGVVNTAPVAVADSYSTNQNTALTIAAAGVLSNDTDANSDPLTAVLDTTTTSGTLALSANGGFIYTPNSGFTGTDSFTYHANDAAADSNIVTVTISVSTPAGLVNGSFESNFTGWTVTGNVAIQSASPYLPTNGTKLAAFNSGNTSPNGVLSQTFATVSGTTYTLTFDAGALAYNTSTQRLQVNVTGSGSLLSQLVTPGGIGGGNNNWTSKSYTFVANSASTTLSFTDTSTTGNGIDLLLDKVSITGPAGPAPTTATLTVASTPATGVSITVSPVDNATLGNGTTSLTRTYNTGTVVSLTAPATSGVAPFVKWQKDGVDFAVTTATTVTLSANTTMTAVYQTVSGSTILVNGSFESDFTGWTKTGNVNIESSAPYTFTDGVKLAGFNGANTTPDGVLSQSFATTPGTSYVLTFDAGVLSYNSNPQKMQVGVTGTGSLLSQTVTVTRTGGSNNLWLPQSFTFVANSTTSTLSFTDTSTSTIGLDLVLDNVKVVVNGSAPVLQTLTIASTPVTAVNITASPNDFNGAGNGTTDFVRAYTTGTVVSLTAPASASGGNFLKWQKNGADYAVTATTTVTMDASQTMTAVFSPPPAATFANGSFESDLSSWTSSGNLGIQTAAPFIPTNGNKLLSFNGANGAPNGVLSQTFLTTPGVSYSLNFDAGILSFAALQQKLQVAVTGSSSLLSQVVTLNGNSSGTSQWTPQSFSFTANTATTTLTFTDISASTLNVDMLLDNITISNANARTLTVDSAVASGVALTISPADNTGASNGNALLTRTYNVGTTVSISAPATAPNGATFVRWVKDGADYAVTPATSVTISADTNLVAVYTGGTFAPLGANILQNGSFEAVPDYNFWANSGATRIEKPGSASGFTTDGNNILSFNVGGGATNGAVEQSFTTTPGTTYTLQLDVGSYGGPAGAAVSQTLNIGVVGSSTLLTRSVTVPGSTSIIPWQPQTFTFTANSTTTILYLTDGSSTGNATDLFVDNVRVKAGTLAPSTLTVNSTPSAGKTMTVSPTDLASQGNGDTNFTRIYPTGSTIQMVAPFANFVKWLKNGAWYATNPSISLVLDGNHTFTAVYTTTPVVGPFTNGSFESEFTGWTWSGSQQSVKVKDGLPTTDGIYIIEFNSNSSGLDGSISQTFTTTPGTTYTVTFDMGTKAFNTAQQILRAQVTGSGSLFSQTYSINGIGNGDVIYAAKSFNFTANSATSTLTFSDQSTTGAGLDLLLDNVKLNGSSGGGGGNPVLTVDSVGASNVAVTVSPADNNAAGNGNTLLTRTYNPGTAVTLTAPASGTGGATFSKWVKDGVDIAFTQSTTVTVNTSTTVYAVYTGGTGSPLGSNILANGSFESLGGDGWATSWARANGSNRIEQPGAASGFPTNGNNMLSFNVGGTGNDGVAQQTFFTTSGTTYTLQLDVGSYGGASGSAVNQTLNVGLIGSGTLLSRSVTVPGSTSSIPWKPQTFTFTANSSTTTLFLGDGSATGNGTDLFVDNVRVQPGSLPPSTITVNSTPAAGKTVTVSPVDLAAQGNGTATFTRTYATGSTIQMVAPFANFVKWLKNGQWYATNPTISVVVDGNHTFTAVYTTTPVLGPFTNGSFESEFTGWTWSGSQQSVKVKDGLPSTDGIFLIEFNSNSSGLDGSISQTFTTTPGTAYTVAFDMGVNAFNTAQQSLRCQVTGSGTLASQTFSMNNPAGNGILYSARTVSFTANTTSTTLTFSDQSATGAGLDLLLDNVRVTAQVPNPGTSNGVVINAPETGTPIPQVATETATPGTTTTTSSTLTATPPKTTTGIKVINVKKYLVLTVVKASLPAGASPVIEVSSDLKTWFSGNAYTTVVKDDDKVLTLRDNTPVRPGAKRYIRLKPIAR